MADPTVPPTGAANQQYWVQHLTFRMSQEGGNELRSAIKAIAGDVRELEGGFDKLSGSVSGSLRTISNLAKAAFGAFGIYATANISNVVGELDKYNKALVALRPLTFQYGAGVDTLEKSMMSIGKTLKFTREQMLSLSQSYLKGFNYAPVAKMSGYLRMAAMAAGENVESMQSYMQVMQGLGKQSAVFERVQMLGDQGEVKTGAIQGLTLAQAAVGKIDPSTYAQVAGYMEAIRKESMGIEDADTRRNKQMREQMETLRNVHKIWDDIKISVAQQIMPLMTQFSRWLATHHDGLVRIASQVISIGKYIAIAGGAVAAIRVAKNILPGMAADRAKVTGQFGTFMAPTADTMSPKGAKAYAALAEKRVKGRGSVSQAVSSALGTAQVGHPVPVTIVGISPGISWGNNWGGTIGNAPAGNAGPAGPAFNPNTWQWQRGRTLGKVRGSIFTGRSHTTADRIAAIRAARGDFRAGTTFGRLGASATRIGPEAFAISTKNTIGKALQYNVGRGAGQAMRAIGLGKLASGGAAISGIANKMAIPIGEISGSVGRAGLGLGRGIAGVGKMAAGGLGAGITGAIAGRELYEQYAPETFKRGFGSRGGGTMGEGLSSIAGGAAAGALMGGPVGAAGGAIVGGAIESGRVFMEGQSIAADAMKAVDENRRKFEDYKKGAIDKAKSLGDTTRVTALEKQGQIREASDQTDKMKSGFGYRFLGLGSDNIRKQEEEVQKLRRAYQGWVDDQALSVTATQEQQDAAKNLRVQIEGLTASVKKLENEGNTGPELSAAKVKLSIKKSEYADVMAVGSKKDEQGRTVSKLGSGGETDKANKVLEDKKQKMKDEVEAADKLLRVSTAYLQYQKQIEEVMESQLRLLESQGTLFQQRQRFAGLAAISDPLGGLTEIKSNFESYMKEVDESEAATKKMIGTFDSLSELVKKDFQLPKLDIEEKRINLIPNEDERNKARAEFEKIKSDRQKLINEINAMNITGPTGQKVTGEQVVEDPEGKARIIAENSLRERRNKLESELNNLAGKRLDASREYSKSLEPAIENQRLQVQQLSTINSLYENFGMGLSASISQRMQLIEAIGKENTLLQQQAGLNSERIDQFGKELQIALQVRSEIQRQADLSTGDNQLKFKGALIEADKKIDTIRGSQNQLLMDQRKIQNDILTNVTKQAEQAKVMREGYISAINAMNTGTGVFKKIVIDQNSQLGILMRQFSGQVPTGVRTGQASPRFAGIGLQESSGFNVGGWYGPAQSLEEHQSKLMSFPIPNVVNGLSPAQSQKAIYDITARSQGASQESRAVMANRGGVSRLMDNRFPAQSFGGMLEIIKKNEQVLGMLPSEMQSQVKIMMRGDQAEISPAQAAASVKTVIETLKTLPANNAARENLPSLEKTYQDEMYSANWANQRSETMKNEITEAMKAKSEAVQNVKVVNTDPIKVQVIQGVVAKANTTDAAPQSPQGFEVSTPEGLGIQMPDGSIVVDTDNILQRNEGGTISFSDDGKIPGRGPNRDTVPAMLTKGEFVLNRDAVDHYGDGFMYALNNRSVPRNMLNVGGFVGFNTGGKNTGYDDSVDDRVATSEYIEEDQNKFDDYQKARNSPSQPWDSLDPATQDFIKYQIKADTERKGQKETEDVKNYRKQMAQKEADLAAGKLPFAEAMAMQSAKEYYKNQELVAGMTKEMEISSQAKRIEGQDLVAKMNAEMADNKLKAEQERQAAMERITRSTSPATAKDAVKSQSKKQPRIVPSNASLDDPDGEFNEELVYPKETAETIAKTTSDIVAAQQRENELVKKLRTATKAEKRVIASERIANRKNMNGLRQRRFLAQKTPGVPYSQFAIDNNLIIEPKEDITPTAPTAPTAPTGGGLVPTTPTGGLAPIDPDTGLISTNRINLTELEKVIHDRSMTFEKKKEALAKMIEKKRTSVDEGRDDLYYLSRGLTATSDSFIRSDTLVGQIANSITGEITGPVDSNKRFLENMETEYNTGSGFAMMPKDDASIRGVLFAESIFAEVNRMRKVISDDTDKKSSTIPDYKPDNKYITEQEEKFKAIEKEANDLTFSLQSGLTGKLTNDNKMEKLDATKLKDKIDNLRQRAYNDMGSINAYESTIKASDDDIAKKFTERTKAPDFVQNNMRGITHPKNNGDMIISNSYKSIPSYADGGIVSGLRRGGIAKDTEFARVSQGEFVMRPEAVALHGLETMEQINSGGPIKRFGDGGPVGVMQAPDQSSRNNVLAGGSQVNSVLKDMASKDKDQMSISTGKSNVSVEIELSQSQMRDMKDALVNDMTSLIYKAMKATESRLMSSLTGGA